MSKFTMKLKGGRPATGGALKDAVERSRMIKAGTTAFNRIAKAGTPRGETGRLQGGWIVKQEAHWNGFTYGETVTNQASNGGYRYAKRVDRVSKRNTGYIGRIMTQANEEVPRAMKERKADLVSELWVKK